MTAPPEYAISFKAHPSILSDGTMLNVLARQKARDAAERQGFTVTADPTLDIVPPDITRAIPADQLGDDPTFGEISSSWPTVIVRFRAEAFFGEDR